MTMSHFKTDFGKQSKSLKSFFHLSERDMSENVSYEWKKRLVQVLRDFQYSLLLL